MQIKVIVVVVETSASIETTIEFNSIPILSQKLEGMHVVRAICSSTAKNKYDDTYFLCHDMNNNDASFKCHFYDQRRRELYNTLLGHRRQRETSS